MTGLRHLKQGGPAIDVRSPGEFLQGHIPGFQNLPILSDDHRHQVGWTYKNHGTAKAVELGHQLVDPLRERMVGGWKQFIGHQLGLVACWRGGLRSRIACEWIEAGGARVQRQEGGYKAMRRTLLEEIQKERIWVVLGGLTGSGKSDLLRRLDRARILDLEKYANHRGSAFGGFIASPQPAQQTFENAIGLHLFENDGPFVVEDESALVGKCAVPRTIRESFRRSGLVRLRSDMNERIAHVYEEYVVAPSRIHTPSDVCNSLLAAIEKISRSLGGVRAAKIQLQIAQAFAGDGFDRHRPWIETLLKDYYDPMYEYGLKKDDRKLLFEGGPAAVREFLTDFINRRRT